MTTAVPAAVVLNLTQFYKLTDGQFCRLGKPAAIPVVPNLTLLNPGQNGNGKPLIKLTPDSTGIVVLKMNADIYLYINDSTGSACSMSGLAIKGLPGNPDPSGGANFKVNVWTQAYISLKALGANVSSTWELYVVILDGAGNLGVIDPQIENDANMNTRV